MGKNTVTINGVSSKQYPSLLIEELPFIQMPQKKVEVIEMDGRSGTLTITDDCYGNTQKTMKCKLRGSENLDSISMWLQDCNKVVFSNRPDRYYKAIINSQIDFERSLANNRSFSVTFDCQPFGYLLDNTQIDITTKNYHFAGKGSYWSEPIITVYGYGNINLSVNDTYITLKNVDEYITINTEKKRTHKESTILKDRKVGDFPTLSPISNVITWSGSVRRIEIIPNWRYLL